MGPNSPEAFTYCFLVRGGHFRLPRQEQHPHKRRRWGEVRVQHNIMKSPWRVSIIVVAVCSLLLLLECIISTVAAYVVASDDSHNDDNVSSNGERGGGYARLVSWIRQNGGRVDSRISCRSNVVDEDRQEEEGEQHPQRRRGMFAIADISSNKGSNDGTEETELLFVPWKLVMGGRYGRMDYNTTLHEDVVVVEKEELMCDVIYSLAIEIQSGERSLWYPYIQYLGRLPHLVANWAKETLVELQGLAPQYDTNRHLRWFDARCSRSSHHRHQDNQDDEVSSTNHLYQDDDNDMTIDEDAINSSLIAFISRASEVGMIPIYDLINHHNGKRNVKLHPTNDGVQLVVFHNMMDNTKNITNSIIIKQGQELYLSYGLKIASTMYRDYGFVESWPTCWNFVDVTSGDNFAFVSFATPSSSPPSSVNGNDGKVNTNGGEEDEVRQIISAINPTEDYLRNMWNTGGTISQEEYESLAIKHTETLSISDLQQFVDAAHVRYNEFLSTISEDNLILVDILRRQKQDDSSSNGAAESRTNNEDIVNAIQYRIAFKSALVGSAIFAESIIANKFNRELDANKNVEL